MNYRNLFDEEELMSDFSDEDFHYLMLNVVMVLSGRANV